MDEQIIKLLNNRKALLFCFANKGKEIDVFNDFNDDIEIVKCNGIEFYPVYELLLGIHNPKEEKNTYKYNYGIFHNFSKDEIIKYIPLIRKCLEEKVIFATTTPTNLNWGLLDLINEITQEHEEIMEIRKNKNAGG